MVNTVYNTNSQQELSETQFKNTSATQMLFVLIVIK